MSHIVEIVAIVAGSLTAIVGASLVFAQRLMSKSGGKDGKDGKDEERKKGEGIFDLDIPTIKASAAVRACPYCRSTNASSQMIPNGKYVFQRRSDRKAILETTWGKDIAHGPTSSLVIKTPNGQAVWQMCTYCLAEWFCSAPAGVEYPETPDDPPKPNDSPDEG